LPCPPDIEHRLLTAFLHAVADVISAQTQATAPASAAVNGDAVDAAKEPNEAIVSVSLQPIAAAVAEQG